MIHEQHNEPLITADDVVFRKIKGKKTLVLKPHRRKRFSRVRETSKRFYHSLTFAQLVLEEASLRKFFERKASKTLMTPFYEASYYYREKFEKS